MWPLWCRHPTPDMPFLFIHIQNLSCFFGKGRVDLHKPLRYVFMYMPWNMAVIAGVGQGIFDVVFLKETFDKDSACLYNEKVMAIKNTSGRANDTDVRAVTLNPSGSFSI